MVAIIALLTYTKLSRGKKHSSADDIINEADVYLAYGLENKAIKLLQEGSNYYPGDEKIRLKLSELTK